MVTKKPKKPKREPTGYEDITGEKDRYGITIGTKTHKAVLMYEKGVTCKQIEDAIGGRHRNILKQLAKAGHRVEKLGGGVFKVTHSSENGKK